MPQAVQSSSPPAAPGPAPRVTKRRAETRARLLEAAFEVFARKGFGQVRIDDVCRAAGYTRGAFYSQFDSIDELFFTLYDQKAEEIARQVADALTGGRPGEAVETAIERASATLLLDRDWLLVKTDFLLHAARTPEVARRLDDHRHGLRDAIENRLRAAGDRIALPDEIAEPSDAARAVVAIYDGVSIQLLLDRDVAAAREWLRQLLTALLQS